MSQLTGFAKLFCCANKQQNNQDAALVIHDRLSQRQLSQSIQWISSVIVIVKAHEIDNVLNKLAEVTLDFTISSCPVFVCFFGVSLFLHINNAVHFCLQFGFSMCV